MTNAEIIAAQKERYSFVMAGGDRVFQQDAWDRDTAFVGLDASGAIKVFAASAADAEHYMERHFPHAVAEDASGNLVATRGHSIVTRATLEQS